MFEGAPLNFVERLHSNYTKGNQRVTREVLEYLNNALDKQIALEELLYPLDSPETYKPSRNVTKKEIATIITLAMDEDTPACAIQDAIAILTKLYKKHPGAINKADIITLYKRIPFDNKFMHDLEWVIRHTDGSNPTGIAIHKNKFKEARAFAATETTESNNNPVTDMYGMTIEQACIEQPKIRDANTYPGVNNIIRDTRDQIIAQAFNARASLYNITKEQLMSFLEDGDTQDNNALEFLAEAKQKNKGKAYL